ncbi:MAG: hypothetical protein NUV77_19605 [Thermoguttaceae bacterium]|jgi:hypothetical protein|nr:hypothetical protein [Thermoguttaceae bacterium]
MTVVVAEKWESRQTIEGPDAQVDLVYIVCGTADDLEASAALLSASPATYNGLVRQYRRLERIAEDAWEGTVHYGRREPVQTGDVTWEFDTTGGTQKLTQSLATIGAYAPPGQTAPNFQGAIGVTHDSVEGVDITVPVFSFSLRATLADNLVTPAYRATIFGLTGRVNNAPFWGFAAGEVLFLGATGTKKNAEDWEITYRFSASPNMTNIPVGPITVASKKGWEYLWVRYADDVDGTAKRAVKRPLAAYVEQVYPYGDFSLLGI